MRDTNYFSLDLEYNSDGKNGVEDIIQVGFAIGNWKESIKITREFLVKPTDKEVVLHPFITDLTGITQERYDSEAISWETVVNDIRIAHETYTPFCNPVTWGLGDAQDLITTVKSEGLEFPFFGRRVIDVKHFFLFIEAANGRALSGGLRSAMGRHKLPFQGTPHRAATDAKNTLRFFFHLLSRQNVLENTIKNLRELS